MPVLLSNVHTKISAYIVYKLLKDEDMVKYIAFRAKMINFPNGKVTERH